MLSKFNVLLFALCLTCNHLHPTLLVKSQTDPDRLLINQNLHQKIADIPLPAGYKRAQIIQGSFAAWLKNIALKKDRTVYRFDGSRKPYQSAQFAVLDISVGKNDLQQCADAVMRLRAEYLFSRNRFSDIVFSDNNGTKYNFREPYNRINFDRYLNRVFGMCGSASLAKQMKTRGEMRKVEPGDVLIRGGFPGHAVIVLDVAVNNAGKKIYLLAQSYMPAQDVHVLLNPVNKEISPWYEVNDEIMIKTPEYTFTKYELKSW